MESTRDEGLAYRARAAFALQGLGKHEDAAEELRAVLAAQPTDAGLLQRCQEALTRSEGALAPRSSIGDSSRTEESSPDAARARSSVEGER
jgi:hypothetical protein